MQGKGYSLIELLVVLAILGLLAAMTAPVMDVIGIRGREADLRWSLREIRQALDRYHQAVLDGRIEKHDSSGYPESLEVLENGVKDAKSPKGEVIYFIRQLPRDPFWPDDKTPAAETWGLRSYESPHDAPEEGDNIYDVYSLSPGTGLNGIPYHSW